MKKINQGVISGTLLMLIAAGTGYYGYYLGRYAILEPPPNTLAPTPTALPPSSVGVPLPPDIANIPPPQPPPVVKKPVQQIIDLDISHWVKTYKNKYFSFRVPKELFVVDGSDGIPITPILLYLCFNKDCSSDGPGITIMANPLYFVGKKPEEIINFFYGQSQDLILRKEVHRTINKYQIIQRDITLLRADARGPKDITIFLVSDSFGKNKFLIQSFNGKTPLLEAILKTVQFK